MSWSWPQFVIAIWLGLIFVLGSVEVVRDRDVSSSWATVHVIAYAAWIVGAVSVLHAGGFW